VSLRAELVVRDRDVEVTLTVGHGETVALLGPNGSGKSTTVSALAGLLCPDTGEVELDDRTLVRTRDRGPEVWVPPHDRGVAVLAQEALLFPHLGVLDNVAFGPRSAGMPRGRARERARHWLNEVGAVELAARRPRELSGGQAQRVALARALATEPRLLLLDEPLSAIDVAVAPALRQLLRRVLRERAAVVVTHDVLDAALLADRVVVMDKGRVVEQGPTSQVLARPTSDFAARIAGLNLVRGRAQGETVVSDTGLVVSGLSDEPLSDGLGAIAVFSPSAVGIYREAPQGSPRNAIRSVVTEIEPHGHQVRVRTEHLAADITPAALAELDLAPGTPVVFSVKASEVAVYAA
jgi:molybdate transport system ATP-binding protein